MRIEVYLPSGTLTNEDIASKFPDWSPKKIEDKIGVRSRHIAAEDETSLDLAYEACKKVVTDEDREKIDFVIMCTLSPEYYMPATACVLQDKLGLRTNIGAFDFDLGCSGYVYGLGVAKSLLMSHLANRVLLVAVDTFSKHVNPRDRSNLTLFGDGAAATVIDREDLPKIHEFSLGTDGSGIKTLIIPNGGLHHRYDPNAEDYHDENGILRNDNYMFMDGPEVFNFLISVVPPMIDDCLKKNGMTIQDVDHFVFHQANQYILKYLRDLMEVPEEKFYINMLETGNTTSATIPIGLKDSLDKGTIKPGDKVMVAGFGVGYSWGATIITI